MIEFCGVYFYIDLTAFDKAVTTPNTKPSDEIKTSESTVSFDENGKINASTQTTYTNMRGKEIDPSRFEIINKMIDIIIDFSDSEVDTTLGYENVLEKSPLPFKIAFNTLINYGILKEKE